MFFLIFSYGIKLAESFTIMRSKLVMILFTVIVFSCTEQVPIIENIKLLEKEESIGLIHKKINDLSKKYSIVVKLDESIEPTPQTPEFEIKTLIQKLENVFSLLELEQFKFIFEFVLENLDGRNPGKRITFLLTTKETTYDPYAKIFNLNIDEIEIEFFLENIIEVHNLVNSQQNKENILFETLHPGIDWDTVKMLIQDLNQYKLYFISSLNRQLFNSNGKNLSLNISRKYSSEQAENIIYIHDSLNQINNSWNCNELKIVFNIDIRDVFSFNPTSDLLAEIADNQEQICGILKESSFSNTKWYVHINDLNFNHFYYSSYNNYIHLGVYKNYSEKNIVERFEEIISNLDSLGAGGFY